VGTSCQIQAVVDIHVNVGVPKRVGGSGEARAP